MFRLVPLGSPRTHVAAVALGTCLLAACGSASEDAVSVVDRVGAEPAVEQTATEEPDVTEEPAAITDPTPAESTIADEPPATELAYQDGTTRFEPPIDEAVCVALVPSDPAPDAIGVVTYRLIDGAASWQYQALWVPNAQGDSALLSGEPSVRNGDAFEFLIDDSMRTANGWVIDTMTPDGERFPCAIQTIDATTAAGLAGNGGSGY